MQDLGLICCLTDVLDAVQPLTNFDGTVSYWRAAARHQASYHSAEATEQANACM